MNLKFSLFLMWIMIAMAFAANNKYKSFKFFDIAPKHNYTSTKYKFENIGFQSFIEAARCLTKTETDRGTKFEDCVNIKSTDDSKYELPTFFGYKCDSYEKVITSLKFFAKYEDSSVIYATYVPVGCYNGKKYAKQDYTMSKIKKYLNKNIPPIVKEKVVDGKKVIEDKIIDGKKIIKFTKFMKIYNCDIKGQSGYADYDATSLVMLVCQQEAPWGFGFRYQHEIKFNLRRNEFNQVDFKVPVCRKDKMLRTEVVDFTMNKNKIGTKYTMRIPIGCGE